MNKLTVSVGMLMVGGLSAFAASFPYTDLTQRYYTNETALSSYSLVEVPSVDGGMKDNENVAVITMADAAMTALDEDGWTECTNMLAAADIQAAFTLKCESDDSDTCQWMGYTGEGWKEFTGSEAKAGTCTVKIEIDYSLDAPKVRYSVGSAVMSCADGTWVALGKNASKVECVDLCGYGTTGAVEGKAASRPVEGNIDAMVEDVGLNYETLRLAVKPSDSVWGVDAVEVGIVGPSGQRQTATAAIADKDKDGYVYVDLSPYIQPGNSYTYDVKLTGSAGSTTAERKVVDLYSSDAWFYFNNADFVNATAAGIDIGDGKFCAADEEVEGAVTPNSAAKANVGVVVTTTFEVSGVCADLADYTENAPQFAVALGGTSDAPVWKYCENGTWKSSTATGLPTANDTYEGRATFDYAAKKVKYEIRAASDGSFFQELATADLPSEKTALAAVAIKGGGSVSALEAQLKLAEPPAVEEKDITQASGGTEGNIKLHRNTEVALNALQAGTYALQSDSGKNCHLKWKDADGKIGKMVNGKLQVVPGEVLNGVKSSFDSYVLGLDAEVATDRPAAVVKPGATQKDGDKVFVPVYVPNLKNARTDELGYTLKLIMEKKTGNAWETIKTQVVDPATGGKKSGEDMNIPLDGGIYRVNTVIE